MALMAITRNEAVNEIHSAAVDAAYDGGNYEGISDSEYAQLQGKVNGLSTADRTEFNDFPGLWTGDRDGAFRGVIDALREGLTYEQFAAKQR
jgi:hypothetical protein